MFTRVRTTNGLSLLAHQTELISFLVGILPLILLHPLFCANLAVSSYVAPKPTTYLKFTASGSGVANGAQTGMIYGQPLNYEIFRFSVTGYDPSYNWVFRYHSGDQYETRGYIDISNCACDSCDSAHQKRVVTQCNLGYPDQSSSRAPTIFNENLILYSFAAASTSNFISLYYADEYPMMLGIDRVRLLFLSVAD